MEAKKLNISNPRKVLKESLLQLSRQNLIQLKKLNDYYGLNFFYILSPEQKSDDKILRQQASFLSGKLNGSWKFQESQAHFLIINSSMFAV
jgi:hypothetical protein